ncbi:hypothetical protein ABPG75_002435 [Micractinium tetrahymenae]
MAAMRVARVLLAALLLASALAPPIQAAVSTEDPAGAEEKQTPGFAGKPAGGSPAAATAAAGSPSQPLWQRWEALYPSSKLSPTLGTLKGHQYVYQIPANPTASLFVSPGCSHAATDWWPASPACPSCLGLPEEVAQTQQALARGYAVLAMTSTNTTGCMDWSSNHKAAVAIINTFRKEHDLESLPLYGLGVSVGGGFVMKLPQHIRMDGLLSEVLGPRPSGWLPQTFKWGFPPSVFVSMDEDPSMAAKITQDSATLRRMGVPTATVRVPMRPVYPTFFSDRSPRISPEASARIVAALHQINMLDERGFVTQDPRHTHKPWVKELLALLPELADGMTEDHSIVWEEMNLAYSSHEIIADFATAAFLWLESGGKADFAELVEKYAPAGSGIVGDAAGAIRLPPAAAALAPPPAAAGQAAQQSQHAQQQQAQQQQTKQVQQQQQQQQQAQGGIQQGGSELAAAPGRVLGVQQEQAQLVQQKASGQQQRPVMPQQAQQQQAGQEAADSSVQVEFVDGAPAAEPPSAAPEDMDAAAASAAQDSAHSAAAIVGGAAGTLAGAAILLVLYRVSERKRAGFAALPTSLPRAPWEPPLPVSQAAGKASLAPIPEGPEEADP